MQERQVVEAEALHALFHRVPGSPAVERAAVFGVDLGSQQNTVRDPAEFADDNTEALLGQTVAVGGVHKGQGPGKGATGGSKGEFFGDFVPVYRHVPQFACPHAHPANGPPCAA